MLYNAPLGMGETMENAVEKPTIRVVLQNRRAIFKGTPEEQLDLKTFYRYRPPGYWWSPRFQSEEWDGWKNMHAHGGVPTGLFFHHRAKVEEKYNLQIEDQRKPPQFKPPIQYRGAKKPRGFQLECLDAMIAASNTGGLIIAATGAGKTFLVALYCERLIGTACFVVDELTLMTQTVVELRALLGDMEVGEVGRGGFNPKRITIATSQTLNLYRKEPAFEQWFKRLDVLFIDEIHVALNRRNADILQSIKPTAVFGLTATLQLEKEHVAFPAIGMAGPPIFTYPLEQSTADGHTVGGKVVSIAFKQDGYDAGYDRLIVRNKLRNDCIEALAREAQRLKLVCAILVERRLHLKILSRRLANLPHAVISGEYSTEERLAAKTAMNARKLPLLLASRVFYKGVDISTIDVLIDGTGRPDTNSAQQRYGRGVRKAKGKLALRYIDISDTGTGNSSAAKARLAAYEQLKVPIVKLPWKGAASAAMRAFLV